MNRGRPKSELVITQDERAQLTSFARSRSLPASLSARARLVLSSAEGEVNSSIAARLGLSKATAVRLTHTLADERFVVHDPASRCYRLGPESFVVGLAAEPSYSLQRLATASLRALALETGDWVFFSVQQGLEVIGDHAFNNRIDPQAIALALRMRSALLRASVDDDWEAWALALTERAQGQDALAAPQRSSITASRLRLLDEFIDAGLGGPLSVQAMAGLLELSEGFFIRAFKQAMGKSPHSYLIDRRLAAARAQLLDSSASLADIALACGFVTAEDFDALVRPELMTGPRG